MPASSKSGQPPEKGGALEMADAVMLATAQAAFEKRRAAYRKKAQAAYDKALAAGCENKKATKK